MKIHKNEHYPWANHCIISLRITPLNPNPNSKLLLLEAICLYCILLATSSRRLSSFAIVGYFVSQRFLDEVIRRLPDSRYTVRFSWKDSVNRLFGILIVLLAYWVGPIARIWAAGFILSSHRRIQFPRFRPTSMSLRCTSRWTLSVASNTVRVFLWRNWRILGDLGLTRRRWMWRASLYVLFNPKKYAVPNAISHSTIVM